MFAPTIFWANPFLVNAGNTLSQQDSGTPIGLSDGRFLIVWVDGSYCNLVREFLAASFTAGALTPELDTIQKRQRFID